MVKMDRLLTLNEAAEFFGLDPESFQVLVQRYNIPHYKIAGKFIRFSYNELLKYQDKISDFKSLGKKTQTIPEEKKYTTKPVEYHRTDLGWGLRLWEFIKFNDFYIISFIVIFIFLYYIFKY